MLELKIQYAKLLDPFMIKASLVDFPDWVPPTKEAVLAKVALFNNIWKEKGDNILKQIKEITELDFEREVIDVFVISGGRCMSHPLIIKSRLTEDEFIFVIVEELLHNLFSRNKQGVKIGGGGVVENHIPVFEVMRKMGLQIKTDNPNYLEAWDKSKND